MAIIQEHFTLNGVDFVRTYSDRGMMIHGGSPEGDYSEASEPASFGRTYTETDIPIDSNTTAEEVLNVLLGGAE